MDEPGHPPPDPRPSSGEASRESTSGPEAPSPAEETASVSVPSDVEPAPAEEEVAVPDEEPKLPEPVDEAGAVPDRAPTALPPAAEENLAAAEQARAAREHERLARENSLRLEHEIESLRAGHLVGARREFRAFFEHERRLHQLFKELSPLLQAERHRLWNALKQVGVEMRSAQQEEWESRRYQSIEARETIEEKLRAAEALAQGARGADAYRKADSLLNEARVLLGSSAADSPGQVLIGPDRRACWDRWRAARDVLRQRRSGLQEQDHQALGALVAEAAERATGGDPFQAVQRVKELQAQLGKAYLRRGQFEELRKRLSEAWQVAQARIVEQRQERTRLRGEWHRRMEGHLARWQETIEHRKGQREHLLQQVAKLEEMEKNARSEDFAAQVRGWKAETVEKLRHTDELVAELEERVRTTAKKIGGRPSGTRAGGHLTAARADGQAPAAPAEPPPSVDDAPHREPPGEPTFEPPDEPADEPPDETTDEPPDEPTDGPPDEPTDEPPVPTETAS